ncbi:MAG: TolC family protein, partial [Muribaculaceae bacterium]|nr:TolC family protein [Muribaculaceae bacterium]
MKTLTKLAALTLSVAISATVTGCHIYKKYEMPASSAIGADYVDAKNQPVDSTALGNLPWQEVFTDPVLTDLINRALENNTDLRNARLNIEVAHANMLGARLSYLPSVALAPNGSGSTTSLPGSKMTWTYQ